MRIDYTKLRGCQLVVCGGDSLVSKFIRGVTSGFRRWSDPKTATHVGLVFELRGRFFIAEVVGDKIENGLRLSPFGKYLKSKKKYIIDIKDCPNLGYADRELIQLQIAKDLDYTLEYDYRGVIGFVLKNVRQDKKKAYCSEYVYQLTNAYIEYPQSFAERVSPLDLNEHTAWSTVPGWMLEA